MRLSSNSLNPNYPDQDRVTVEEFVINHCEQDRNPYEYCYRGICYDRLKQYALALADFDRAIALKPEEALFYHVRGHTHQQLGNFQQALSDYELVTQIRPLRASVYDDRAEIYRIMGNYDRAIEECTQAISLNPQFVEAYFRRGITYAELGKLENALVDLDHVIELDPQHVHAYIQRGWIYFRLGNYTLAIRNCRDVQSFAGAASTIDHPVAFCSNYLLGIINSLSGLEYYAIEYFTRSIEISPDYVAARYHRGIIYYQLGDISQAMTDFEAARTIQNRVIEKSIDRDETSFYAEGLALYYLGELESAHRMLNLAAFTAKQFNNHSFHQKIILLLEKLYLGLV